MAYFTAHLIPAAGQRAGSGLSSGEQPWAACRATQVLQRVPGLPLGQQQQQQQQQYQTAGRGYLSNGYSAGLPSALSQVAPQNFYDLSSLRLQQQANNLQQQYQASLFEAHLRAQPQSQHLRYPFPSSEATAVLNAYPLNNLANYARAGVNEVSSSGLTRGMQASGIHQNTNYFRLQGSGQNLAPGASRNLQNVQNLPSNISFLPNNNTAQSSWTSTSRVGNIPQTQPTDSSCKLVYVPEDDHQLNPFQRFARQQMEFFEAGEDDLNTGCQGRNKVSRRICLPCLFFILSINSLVAPVDRALVPSLYIFIFLTF